MTSPAGATPSARTESRDEWCRRLTDERTRYDAGDHRLPADRGCKQGFSFRMLDVRPANESADGSVRLAILQHQPEGEREVYSTTLRTTAIGFGTQVLTEFTAGDIEGDGQAEVLYGLRELEERPASASYTLLQLRGERLEPLHIAGLEVQGIDDVDGDGLYDVHTNAPYHDLRITLDNGAEVPLVPEGIFVAHARGKLTFERDDEVTRKALDKRCREHRPCRQVHCAGPQPMASRPDLRDPVVLLCQRAQGQSAAALKSALTTQCRDFTNTSTEPNQCPAVLLRVVQREPPVHLTSKG